MLTPTYHKDTGEARTHKKDPALCKLQPTGKLRPGDVCPRCREGIIDYNGMLDLICPVCGLTETGACT